MKLQIKENDALIFAIGITLLIFFFTLLFVDSGIKSLNSQIASKKSEYIKVLALYNKIKINSSNKNRFNNDILIFVQKLESLGNIKNKIVSVNTIGSNNVVQIRMVALNLPQLIGVFKMIERYVNIKISQFVIKRNFSSTQFVDLDIILRKSA